MNESTVRWLWMAPAACVLSWYATSGPHLYDSGELVTAAWQLGASHPPGQPLHALVGHAVCLFPLGPVPWRVALMSVACVVLASHQTASFVGDILRDPEVPRWARRLAPEAAGCGTLFSPVVLRQSNRVEVYGLALLLFVVALRNFYRYASTLPPREATAGPLGTGLLASGLAFAVHPPHGAAALAALTVSILWLRRDSFRKPRRLAWSAVAGAIPILALSAYYPLRATAHAPMWGNPTTWSGFYAYVSAAAYRQNLITDESISFGSSLLAAGQEWLSGAGMAAAIGALIALTNRTSRSTAPTHPAILPWLVAVIASAGVGLITPVDRANPDTVAYLAPAVVGLIALGCVGLALVTSQRAIGVALGAIGLTALALHPMHLDSVAARVHTNAPDLHTLSVALTETPAPHALVVVENDFDAATWMAAQSVEGARPDVTVLIRGLSTSSWHWQSVMRHATLSDGPIAAAVPGDGYARYTQGAILRARQRVEVLSETNEPLAGRGLVAGTYLAIPPVPVASPHQPARTGDRLAPYLGRAARAAHGDGAQVQDLLRMVALRRAERMYVRGRLLEARPMLKDALPAEARNVTSTLSEPARAVPRVVYERQAIGRSAEDAVRLLATWLWAANRSEDARRLLSKQLERGDAVALLQLAWIDLAEGRPENARQAVSAFQSLRSSGEHVEAERLERALGTSSGRSQ